MTGRGNRYDSRRFQGGAWPFVDISVRARVVDLEVVELPRRAVTAELSRVSTGEPGMFEELGELRAVLVPERLLHAVGTQFPDLAADIDARLVDRVAERL